MELLAGPEAVNLRACHAPHCVLYFVIVDAPLASPTRSALARLGHQGIELLAGPEAVNLRACHAPHCVLYFVKSHPRREWCSEACGNRVRAARHYERVRNQRPR
ncbi:hypothetical protein FZI93_08310 [Mycobacterium sp. CBMA361]|nr:hypothetical protein [Mycolicibacterium sp. CBMA 361]